MPGGRRGKQNARASTPCKRTKSNGCNGGPKSRSRSIGCDMDIYHEEPAQCSDSPSPGKKVDVTQSPDFSWSNSQIPSAPNAVHAVNDQTATSTPGRKPEYHSLDTVNAPTVTQRSLELLTLPTPLSAEPANQRGEDMPSWAKSFIVAVHASTKSIEAKLDTLTSKIGDLQETVSQVDRRLNVVENEIQTLKPLRTKIDDLEKSVTLMANDYDTMRKNQDRLRKGLQELEELHAKTSERLSTLAQMEDRVIDQEARSRRNNLLFHGIREEDGEECIQKLEQLLSNKLKIENVSIIRAHRLGKRKRPEHGPPNKPRPIIAAFLDYRQKEKVREAGRHLQRPISITPDLPKEIRMARDSLKPDLQQAKSEGRRANIAHPARLIVDSKVVRAVRPTFSA